MSVSAPMEDDVLESDRLGPRQVNGKQQADQRKRGGDVAPPWHSSEKTDATESKIKRAHGMP